MIRGRSGPRVRRALQPVRANASARLSVLASTGTTSTVRTVRTLVSIASSVSPSLRWQQQGGPRSDRGRLPGAVRGRRRSLSTPHLMTLASVGSSSSTGIWLAPGGHPQPQAGFGAGATTIVRVNRPARLVKGVSRIGGPGGTSGRKAGLITAEGWSKPIMLVHMPGGGRS